VAALAAGPSPLVIWSSSPDSNNRPAGRPLVQTRRSRFAAPDDAATFFGIYTAYYAG
jgi:hypothetical protein